MKRLTTDEFVIKAKLVHGDKYDYSKYKYFNAVSKGIIICKTHGEFLQCPNAHLAGNGCFECAKVNRVNNSTYPLEKIQQILKDKNKNIQIINGYKNTHSKCLCKCNIDGYEWLARPHHIIINDTGCPMCARNARLTNEIADSRLMGTNIVRLEDIQSSNINIKWKCLLDDYVWSATPNNILNGITKCPRCSGKEVLTNELVDLKLKDRDIIRLDDVKGAHRKIRWKCLIDGYIWQAMPATILNRKCGCLKCSKREPTNNDKIDEALKNDKRSIIRFSDAHKCKDKVLWKCLECENVWEANVSNVVNNKRGCPKCNLSKGEELVSKWLADNNIGFLTQHKFPDCVFINPLPFDFYCKDFRTCIEYDGKQHYEKVDFFGGNDALNGVLERDFIKTRYCKAKRIHLIRIDYLMTEVEMLAKLNEIWFYKV